MEELMARYTPILLAAALAVAPTQAETQTPTLPAVPGVEQLVATALERSPALAALRAKVAAAREMERPAAALPDPMVEAMLQNAGTDYTVGEEEMSMLGVEVRQGFLYPGKRRAAGDVARAETAQREAELRALERQVTVEIRRTYARLYAVDRERQSLQAARELVDMLSATAASRYAAGEAEQEALIKAQIEVSRLGEELDDLANERAAMVAEINRWLDQPGDAPLGEIRELPAVSAPAQPWEALAVESAPEVAVGKAAENTAERRLRAAELELRPNLSAAAGLGSRGSMDPVVTLRFGVELPFWRKRKQEPMIRAAGEELRMAQREVDDAAAMARAEAARLGAAWRNAETQIQRFREAIVPQTSIALDAARSSYLAGRGDFSTVIEDFELWLEARVQLARREADRFIAWADLERLTRVPPSASTPAEGDLQ
jgi:outer membrane protein TolC